MFRTILIAILSLFAACFNAFGQDPNYHIYLCFGQSNMAGAGDIETQDKTVDSRFQFMKPQDCSVQKAGNWYAAVPPLWGCSGGIGPADYFGRTMAASRPANIKIGVVVVAVPGCKIELFGKTGYAGLDTYNNVPAKYNGSAYTWLLDMAKLAQKDGVIKGILLHQGESNTGDQAWPSKVKAVYDNLMADLGLNPAQTPLLAGELLYQNQGGACYGHNPVIAKLPSVIPNSYVISANSLPGKDQYHFNSAGNRTFGARYAEKMLALQPLAAGPAVSLTSPAAGSAFTAPASITLTATAAATGGSVTKVEFYNGTAKLGEDAVSPYSYSWANIVAGTYTITAVATDNAGNKTTSAAVELKVNPAQTAYNGTPWPIPGKIELENYDIGGNGNAYLDNAATNSGGAAFRMDEDVDIEVCKDADAGYNIGYATAGEWLEYTVNVAAAGKYDLSFRVACANDGRTISLSANDVLVAKDIAIPNTAGWQAWEDVAVPNISLGAGTQVLRITIGALDYVNLNNLSIAKQAGAAVQLRAGWNLVGCPIAGSTELSKALASIWGNVLAARTNTLVYDKSAAPALNTLKTLEWGEGYYIKVDKDCGLQWE